MPAVLLIVGAIIVLGALALAFLPSNKPTENTDEAPLVEVVEQTGDVVSVPTGSSSGNNDVSDAGDSTYRDGIYTTDVSYQVPSGQFEPVKVTITLDNDIITDVELKFEGIVGTSRLNQAKFVGAYEPLVIGKDIDSLNLSRVGGASLTTGAFNNALQKIKADAA